jgi:hypothetical protein
MTKLTLQWIRCGERESDDQVIAKEEVHVPEAEAGTFYSEAASFIKHYRAKHRPKVEPEVAGGWCGNATRRKAS